MHYILVSFLPYWFCTHSSRSCAAALDEEYISTYFLATSQGWFFYWCFASGLVQVLIVRTNSCNLQARYRLCRKTEYIYIGWLIEASSINYSHWMPHLSLVRISCTFWNLKAHVLYVLTINYVLVLDSFAGKL